MSQQPTPPPIMVSTMNDLPGYRVVHVFGEVFGLIVRSRNVFSNIGAGFKSLAGGEIGAYTKLLGDSRNEAVNRLRHSAGGFGANAVLAMRFDCNEIAGSMSEVAAYGTAVYVVPLAQPAPPAQQAAPAQPAPAQPASAQPAPAQAPPAHAAPAQPAPVQQT